MKNVCVIGTGISGSTIANLLSKKYKVDVYEKAKGIGGRSSYRRYLDNFGFDHGLQYISPKTSKFKKFCYSLQKKQVLKNWQGPHKFNHNKVLENKKHTKLIGVKGNNAISKYLLKNINCIFGYELFKIERIKKNWKLSFLNGDVKYYEILIISIPFAQSKKLLIKFLPNFFKNKNVKMDANITVMTVTNKIKNNFSSFLFDDEVIGWAAKENSKNRFKYKYDLWTIQSTFKWANKNILKYRSNKKRFTNFLINRFNKLSKINVNKIYFSNIHGWLYSANKKNLKIQSFWSNSLKVGICGDWFGGPRYENGWISASDLYKKMIN